MVSKMPFSFVQQIYKDTMAFKPIWHSARLHGFHCGDNRKVNTDLLRVVSNFQGCVQHRKLKFDYFSCKCRLFDCYNPGKYMGSQFVYL